jgi:hypothetical protein
MKKILLEKYEQVVAVIPQHARGLGWSNEPTWIVIRGRGPTYREECIQPEERTRELSALYEVGATLMQSLIAAVPTEMRGEGKKGASHDD